MTVPWAWTLTALGAAMVIGGTVTSTAMLLVTGAIVLVLSVEFWTVRVIVDRHGLTIRWGPLGLPRTRFPLDRVASATVIDVRPGEWGGWGYRGSVKVFGRAAVVLRAGTGIRVDLVGGRAFAVTVDDAETGARLLNDLAARTEPG